MVIPRPLDPMRRIFIIRHGNTFESSASACRIGARTDLPLVESGRAQADRLGKWFAAQGLAPCSIHSGPLSRARETASRIAAALNQPVEAPLPWLDEIDHGPDEGRPEAEVLARIGESALTAWDEQAIPPRGWTVNAPTRIAAWQSYFAQGGEGTDLLVTSNGAARFALLALGLSPASLKLRTGAYGELIRQTDGSVKLQSWDQRP